MKILITGSSGFLGSAFIDFLNKKKVPFVLYNRTIPNGITSDFDRVVHFAGVTPHTKNRNRIVKPQAYDEANVEGTRKLLSVLAKTANLKKIVDVGSAAEYGFSKKPISENMKESPEGPYGRSKLKQGKLIEAFAKYHKIQSIHLRIFNIAGLPQGVHPKNARVHPSIFGGLVDQFSRKSTGAIEISNQDNVRDYVDIDDVMDAIFSALTTSKGGLYEVINISSGTGTTIGKLAQLFSDYLHRPYTLKNRSQKVDMSIGNPDKAFKILGWRAKTTLQESIQKILGVKERLIIVGAGVAGQEIVKKIKKEKRSDIVLMGFVDDDPKKQNRAIARLPILGSITDLPHIINDTKATQVLVSTPSVGSDVTNRVMGLVPTGFPIKVLPSVSSVILGKVDLSYVRDIDSSDLIGRPLVKADQVLIAKHVKGKRFLITGGAGSIGSEIVRQLSDSGAKEIVVFDSWEEGVFNVLEEMASLKGGVKVVGRIGNVRDKERLAEVFNEFSFDAVIHAAAYKHVPLMEENAREAEKTNVGGTKNVLEATHAHGVSDFVLISTDKAVHPSSVMGETKRRAELLVKAYAKNESQGSFSAVRFGNVLNSSGSAVPKFLKQIRARQPVTITHREMTRYFMAIPEAVSLVLTSWIIAKNGQILLLDMGEPVRILDLAEKLIRIHGLKPYVDIPIVETGVRPGEKIHEELSYSQEALKPSSAPRIFIAEEL